MNPVDKEAIRLQMTKAMESNNDVKSLVRLGTQLLEKSERPNMITLDQFLPYVEIFCVDKELYAEEGDYYYAMNRLYNRYKLDLGINEYQPTIVVNNMVEKKNLIYLDRRWTRVKSDTTPGESFRDKVPVLNKSAASKQDQLALEASLGDLVAANMTEQATEYFNRMCLESAVLHRFFMKFNASDKVKTATDEEKKGDSDAGDEIEFELDDE